MILIVSDEFDQSTNIVIDWLRFFKKDFFRINNTDKCEIVKIDFSSNVILLKIGGKLLDFDLVTSYWYRRGNFNIQLPSCPEIEDMLLKEQILNNLKEEINALLEFLHSSLELKKSINGYNDNYTNKLKNLALAKKCGLYIPQTVITSQKDIAREFIEEKKDVITKAIAQTIMLSLTEKETIKSYTSQITSEEIATYSSLLFPSLFQKNVSKKYELRIFYLNDEFYPMAIFSQGNDQTKTDFRNYDQKRPNRNVPFQLPDIIERKLSLFMKLSKLNSGSIDMLVTRDNEYVFLEVNPIGQFGMTSFPCNYYLEKRIAEFL